MTKEVFILTESDNPILEDTQINVEVSDANDNPRSVTLDAEPMMDFIVRNFLN